MNEYFVVLYQKKGEAKEVSIIRCYTDDDLFKLMDKCRDEDTLYSVYKAHCVLDWS